MKLIHSRRTEYSKLGVIGGVKKTPRDPLRIMREGVEFSPQRRFTHRTKVMPGYHVQITSLMPKIIWVSRQFVFELALNCFLEYVKFPLESSLHRVGYDGRD
jgi:hypothetical protein